MQEYQTEQEKFWAGEFGHEYIKRNDGAGTLANKTAFFAKIISCLPGGEREFLYRAWCEYRFELGGTPSLAAGS